MAGVHRCIFARRGGTCLLLKGDVKDNFGTGRIYIWKNTLKVVPENMENGVGIDNFYYAFGYLFHFVPMSFPIF